MDGFLSNCRFSFFVKFYRSGTAIIFIFWTHTEDVSYASKKAPNQAKVLINMVSVTLKGLWMVSDRIVDFRFFVKFHSSGPSIICSLWTLKEHVSYVSKKLLIKRKSSSTWWAFLWKDYGCFLIKLSILSNFTGPDLQ